MRRTRLLRNILSSETRERLDINPNFTFEVSSLGAKITPKYTAPDVVLAYSYNKKDWFRVYSGETITVLGMTHFAGTSSTGGLFKDGSSPDGWLIEAPASPEGSSRNTDTVLSGDIMALVMDTFEDTQLKTTVPAYAFFGMFRGVYHWNATSGIVGNSVQIARVFIDLPAKTLAPYCYAYMFAGCHNLTTAQINNPSNATLAQGCYSHMFESCGDGENGHSFGTNMLLDSTVLAPYCYDHMFAGVMWNGGGEHRYSLPSVLPATSLAEGCYAYMFYGTSFVGDWSIELRATTLADNCYFSMFGVNYNYTNYTFTTSIYYTGTNTDSIPSGLDNYPVVTLRKKGSLFSAEQLSNLGGEHWTQVQI